MKADWIYDSINLYCTKKNQTQGNHNYYAVFRCIKGGVRSNSMSCTLKTSDPAMAVLMMNQIEDEITSYTSISEAKYLVSQQIERSRFLRDNAAARHNEVKIPIAAPVVKNVAIGTIAPKKFNISDIVNRAHSDPAWSSLGKDNYIEILIEMA